MALSLFDYFLSCASEPASLSFGWRGLMDQSDEVGRYSIIRYALLWYAAAVGDVNRRMGWVGMSFYFFDLFSTFASRCGLI